MLRQWLSLVFLSGLCSLLPVYASTSSKIDSLMSEHLSQNNAGIMIVNAKTHKTIYRYHADHYFIPASNTKLFTAAAALLYLGANYTFNTSIATAQNNVYITFSGDPSLTAKDIGTLIAQLKQHNINTINGNIILDNNIFSGPRYALGWAHDDLVYYYAAPVTSIIIDQNSVPVKILREGKHAAKIQFLNSRTIPITTHLTFANERELKTCVFEPQIGEHNKMYLGGCLPDLKEQSFCFAITDPVQYAKAVIRARLRQQGIVLRGQIITGTTPQDAKILYTHTSIPLSQLLGIVLKYSNNLYANAITKALGRKYYGVGSFKAGVNAINAILQQHIGKDFTQPRLEDGAGESVYNLITPQQTIQLLRYMYHSKLWPYYRNALATSGGVGTLEYRMQEGILRDHVIGKTGTMSGMGVSSLSGYILRPKHSPILFAIYVNNFLSTTRQQIRDTQDQIVLAASQAK